MKNKEGCLGLILPLPEAPKVIDWNTGIRARFEEWQKSGRGIESDATGEILRELTGDALRLGGGQIEVVVKKGVTQAPSVGIEEFESYGEATEIDGKKAVRFLIPGKLDQLSPELENKLYIIPRRRLVGIAVDNGRVIGQYYLDEIISLGYLPVPEETAGLEKTRMIELIQADLKGGRINYLRAWLAIWANKKYGVGNWMWCLNLFPFSLKTKDR